MALVISGLMLFLSSGADTYEVEYNSSALEDIKEAGEEFNSISTNVDSNVSDLQLDEGDYDKSGSLLSQGINSLKTIKNSYSMFNTLLDSSLENMKLGEFARLIKISLIALIVTVFTLGIILVAVVRVKT